MEHENSHNTTFASLIRVYIFLFLDRVQGMATYLRTALIWISRKTQCLVFSASFILARWLSTFLAHGRTFYKNIRWTNFLCWPKLQTRKPEKSSFIIYCAVKVTIFKNILSRIYGTFCGPLEILGESPVVQHGCGCLCTLNMYIINRIGGSANPCRSPVPTTKSCGLFWSWNRDKRLRIWACFLLVLIVFSYSSYIL